MRPPPTPVESDRLQRVHARRPAMASWFEVWLVGADAEHLRAVGAAALEAVADAEAMLSRYDPAAEVARVNREAAERPVQVSVALLRVLVDARRWHAETDGAFDVCAGSGVGFDAVETDTETRTVRFLDPAARFDFGGYGKGYALDAAAAVLRRFGVGSALLHGGTSSALALGTDVEGRPWRVALRHPFGGTSPTPDVALDGALSCSAVTPAGASEIVDPAAGRLRRAPAACAVTAPTATAAEVLSTALLAMGRARAEAYVLAAQLPDGCRAAWMDLHDDAYRRMDAKVMA